MGEEDCPLGGAERSERRALSQAYPQREGEASAEAVSKRYAGGAPARPPKSRGCNRSTSFGVSEGRPWGSRCSIPGESGDRSFAAVSFEREGGVWFPSQEGDVPDGSKGAGGMGGRTDRRRPFRATFRLRRHRAHAGGPSWTKGRTFKLTFPLRRHKKVDGESE